MNEKEVTRYRLIGLNETGYCLVKHGVGQSHCKCCIGEQSWLTAPYSKFIIAFPELYTFLS